MFVIKEGKRRFSIRTISFILLSMIIVISLFFSVRSFAESSKKVNPLASSASTNRITIDVSKSLQVSQFGLGSTYVQDSPDPGNNAAAVASAKKLVTQSLRYENVQIMGWGAGNPEPKPDVYDWSSLDARVQLMRESHGTMVLTICCAPGWMHPQGFQDDWDNLEIAPAPEHVQEYANLAKAVAQRYPDVEYFQVWNELKGMWSDQAGATRGIQNENRWDYERYTTLYNAVYDAVKSVHPNAKIGGPYVVVDSGSNASQMSDPGPTYAWGTLDQRSLDVITYWNKHKHGADFLTLDSSSDNKDGGWKASEFRTAQKFADIQKWVRTQGISLPIWWAEYYVGHPANAPKNLNYYNAVLSTNLIYTLLGGAAVALTWGPQGDAQGFAMPEGIFTDTSKAGGGQATPFYTTAKAFKDYFGPGTPLYSTKNTSSSIVVLAGKQKTMLVNQKGTQQVVSVNGANVVLKAYEVKLINTPTASK